MSEKLENAKALYLEGIRDGNYEQAIHKYTGDRYTQHSTGVRDGKEGFIEFFSDFVKRNPKRDIQILRGWEDGRYVFLHVYQNIGDGQAEWVTTDFFDTDENNKIIEHWDVISSYQNSTLSGHTSTDGPTKINDFEKTDKNKTLVKEFLKNAFMEEGNKQEASHCISSRYTEHSYLAQEDGADHFIKFINQNTLLYKEVVLCVGSGDFVATLSRVNKRDDDKNISEHALVDIFRIENKLIAEHWYNTEKVPQNDVNSGKF